MRVSNSLHQPSTSERINGEQEHMYMSSKNNLKKSPSREVGVYACMCVHV